MPPKKDKKGKKGKKGKGKGKKGSAKTESAAPGTPGSDIFQDKEELLQKELDQLTEELISLKDRVQDLRQDNDWLQQEAHKTRIESHEYMSYMEKKTAKRQTTIISLSDQNQKEINDINEEKNNMLEEFAETKQELQNRILEKENLLHKTIDEQEDLQEYKNLQKEQLTRIKELEKEVMTMRGLHSDTIQQLKAKFLKEKHEFQLNSEHKIQQMAKQANKEAFSCLNDHTNRIKLENRKLRHELLKLIQQTRSLHEHRRYLEDQHKQLLREQQYANDLQKIRSTRQHKVLKSFGIIDNDGNEMSEALSPVNGLQADD